MPSRNLAILVGVGSFQDSAFKTLRFCHNDIDDLGRVLSNPDIAQFEVRKLHAPERDQILETLDKSASELKPEDKLIFYYAGHGKRSPSGRLYLVAKDTKMDALRATGVPIDQVLEIMQESKSSQRVMILDCCHSGAVGGEFRGDIADNLQELARARGTCILAASTGIQLAEERESANPDGRGNGIFTRYLVEGLQGGMAAGDAEVITVDGLYDYAFNRVVTTSTQTPMKWIIGGVGNIVIGKSTSSGWQNQKKAIQEEFRNLHTNRLISGAYLDGVLQITSKDWGRLKPDERSFGNRLQLFSRKEITLIELLESDEEPPAPPKAESSKREDRRPNIKEDTIKSQSIVDWNLIAVESSPTGSGNVWLSAFGPILMLAACVVVLAVTENLGAERSVNYVMAISFGIAGLTYCGFLLRRQMLRIQMNKGISLRSITSILTLLIPVAGFAILLLIGIFAASL